MELTAEQQTEYDELHKGLVAQGGPTIGTLKTAGRNDPEGVARLIELGWVNPEAVEVDFSDTEPTGNPEAHDYGNIGKVKSDFAKAEKEAKEAEKIASDAIDKANRAAEIAESKRPPACWRCGGDGTWHSTKTGYRAKTSSEPLHDPSRPCPECGGTK